MSTELTTTNGGGELAKYEPQPSPGIAPRSVEQALRLAEVMSAGKLGPQHLRGSVADCFLVIEQACRWGLSPFAVAQCTSVIQGKLMFEGKLVAAVVNACGGLEERLDFVYSGTGDNREVKVVGRLKGEERAREVDVKLRDARTNNQMWQKQPDQQLAYHGARVWARRHMPELMLGVYSPEEMDAPGPKAPAATWSPSAESVAPSASDAAVSTAGTPGNDVLDDEVECFRLVEEGSKKAGTYKCDWLPAGRRPRRTLEQNKKLQAMRHDLGLTDANWRAGLAMHFGKETSKDLSTDEADDLIDKLQKRWNMRKYKHPDDKRAAQEARSREVPEEMREIMAEGRAPSEEG